jgi:hypothetical protein
VALPTSPLAFAWWQIKLGHSASIALIMSGLKKGMVVRVVESCPE